MNANGITQYGWIWNKDNYPTGRENEDNGILVDYKV